MVNQKCNICGRKFKPYRLGVGGRCSECRKLLSQGKSPGEIKKIIASRGR